MSDIPKITSKEQLLGDLIDTYLSKTQTVNDLRKGSVSLSLLEAFAEVGFKLSSDNIAMLDAISLDRASGDALKRTAVSKKVPIFSATNSSGYVNITDKSFTKIQDKIYAGRPAPVAGSAFLFISDASAFPEKGTLYIGRGTSSVEGPLSYGTTVRLDPDDGMTPVQGIVSKAGGAYYMVVLDNTNETTKFHNIGESIVLGQGGDRLIPSGTTVQTSQATAAESVTFITTSTTKILDGEVEVKNVPIVSQQSGTQANVARGAIREVLGVGFDASCTNPLPLTNARDDDTDEVLRERIKQYEQSRAKGVEAAILRYSKDVISPDELKRATNVKIKRTTGAEQIVIVDDGTGYEPIDGGVGLEQLLDEALGGEREFQLLNTMIQRASVKTLTSAPFDIIAGDVLQVEIVGQGVFSHTFQEGDFRTFRQADAFEVVSSINSNYTLPFVARTINSGAQVMLTPKDAQNIKVLSGGANLGLKFPTNPVYTLRLYRNDKAVYQEGKPAFVTSLPQPSWGTIVSGYTFTYTIDNSTAISVVITDIDFQKYGPTYVVNKDMPIDIWAKVLNDKLPGVTTTVVGDALRFTSNLGFNSRAAIEIDTSNTSYVGASMFGTNAEVMESGLSADFNLNLKTGQLEWIEAFDQGETATAGSKFTRAKIESFTLPTALSLGSNNIYMWLTVDGDAASIPHGTSGVNVTVEKNPSGYPTNTAKISANSGAYADVAVGDYMIIWKNAGETYIAGTNCGIFRVFDVDPNGDFVIINAPDAVSQMTAFALPALSRFVFVRSQTPVQVMEIDPNVVTSPTLLRDAFNAQIVGARSYTIGTIVRLESKTLDENKSQICVVALTDNSAPLGYTLGTFGAVSSHNGYVNSEEQKGFGMPTFKLLESANPAVNPAILDNGKYLLNEGTQNDIIQWLDWNSGFFNYSSGAITSYNYKSQNKGVFEQVRRYNTSTNRVEPVRRRLSYLGTYDDFSNSLNLDGGYYLGEPYTLRQGLTFDAQDKLSFIADLDEVVKSYISPVSRKVSVLGSPFTPNALQFDLGDAESNLSFNNPATFRDFDFSDFKFWTKPKLSLQGMDFQYADFGPSGSKAGISLRLPTASEQDASHEIREGDITDIRLNLASGAALDNESDFSTTWITEIVSTVGTTDYVRYTYKTGTPPNLVVTPASIVNIGAGSSLRTENKGVFVVTTNPLYPPTATDFTIERYTGQAQTDFPAVSSLVYPAVALEPFANGGTIQVTTSTNHNLSVGDIVGLYGVDVSEYENSFKVIQVTSPTVFRAKIEANTIFGGSVSQVVRRIELATVATYNPLTFYPVGAVVEDSGMRYIAITDTLGDTPNISPASWQVIPLGFDYITVLRTSAPHNLDAGDSIKISDMPNLGISSFNGTFSVFTVPDSDMISHLHNIGIAGQGIGSSFINTPTAISVGRVDQQASVFGNIAKGLKLDGELEFYDITQDQQGIADYINDNLSSYLAMTPTNPTAPVTQTGDMYVSTTSTIDITPVLASDERIVTFDALVPFTKGAKITMQLPASANPLRADIHNVELTVISVDGASFRVKSSRTSLPSETTLSLGLTSYIAIQETFGFGEGESYVYTNNLGFPAVSPSFTLKKPLVDLAAGDEAYLIATNPEQLSRLIARLANSGLSNVSEIGTSVIDSELQVKTNTFGSSGGMQMAGGRANSHAAAIIGAGQERNGLGGFDIQSELRIGFTAGSFIRAYNSTSAKKVLGQDSTTQISISTLTGKADIEITAGAGTFQTKRPVVMDGTQDFKVEKHGAFYCYQQVGGTALDLITQGVREGDWVRIQDDAKSALIQSYSRTGGIVTVTTNAAGHSFGINDRITIADSNSGSQNIDGTYIVLSTPTFTTFTIALAGSNFGSQTPLVSSRVNTEPRFLSTNQGIFKVVALYGDAFWIENPNGIEQYAENLQPSCLAFYSHDSVMPNDRLQISSSILGSDNIGTFIVDSWNDREQLPASNKIRVVGTLQNQAATSLGSNSEQFSLFEKDPLSIVKKVYSTSPSQTSGQMAFVSVTNSELIDRINVTYGGGIESLGKLGMDESTKLGLDAYRYYKGLIAELYKVIYGDPNDPIYEGVRAAGTDIDIQPPLVRRIKVTLSIRVKTGIPFSEIIDAVKSAAAGYINSLGPGQHVSLSAMTSAVQTVDGIVAVIVDSTSPAQDNGLIKVLPEEVANIKDPDADIVVNIISG